MGRIEPEMRGGSDDGHPPDLQGFPTMRCISFLSSFSVGLTRDTDVKLIIT